MLVKLDKCFESFSVEYLKTIWQSNDKRIKFNFDFYFQYHTLLQLQCTKIYTFYQILTVNIFFPFQILEFTCSSDASQIITAFVILITSFMHDIYHYTLKSNKKIEL